jgi:hypothetical protein
LLTDVFQDPEMFVQVILGCSFGKPEALGYDTTMKVWQGPGTQPVHSFSPHLDRRYYLKQSIDKNWIIEMPGPGDTTEVFLTIRPISIVRAETMSGRATVVWVVMRLEDVGVANHKVNTVFAHPVTSL